MKATCHLLKLRDNLAGLSTDDSDVFAAMVRRVDLALDQREEELGLLSDGSKGGNIRGITEDRRFMFADELQLIRKTREVANAPA